MGLVQHASGTASSGSTVTATFGSNTASGNTIIACVSNKNGLTVSSVALTGSSDTWAQAAAAVNSGFSLHTEIWYDNGNSAGHTGVTVTLSASGTSGFELDIYEWSGIVTSSPLDKTSTNFATSSSFTSNATATLSQASEVAFGSVVDGNTTITGPSSPWTNEPQLTAAGSCTQMSGYQQVSATTALSFAGNFSGSVGYAAAIATFKLSAAGGPPKPLMMIFP